MVHINSCTVKSRIKETNFKKLQANFIKVWITEDKRYNIIISSNTDTVRLKSFENGILASSISMIFLQILNIVKKR